MKNRRLRRFLFLSFLLGLGIVLFQFIRLPFLPVRLHEAVPNSTAVMLQFETADAVNKILETDGNFLQTEQIKADFELFQKVFPTQKDGQLLAALRAPNFDFLYVKKRENGFNLKDAIAELEPVSTREINFEKHILYEVQISENESLIITRFRNLLVFARQAYLVEESVTQLYDYWGSLRGEKYFRRVERTEIPNAAAYVYVNFKNISTQFSANLGLKKANDIATFGNWVNWMKLGLVPNETGYKLGGAITGELSFLAHLDDLKDENIFKILPDNLAVCTWMEAPLVGQFSSEFQQYFQPWISGEIAYANLESNSAKQTPEKFLVVKSTDTKLSEKLLGELGAAAGKLESYDYQMFHIEQLLADDVLMPVFGKRLNPIKNPYYTVLENFVVFCNSKSALEQWLDKYLAGQTLSSNVPFLQIQPSQPDTRKVHFSLNFSKLNYLLQEYLQAEQRADFANLVKNYSQFGILSLGLYPQGQRSLVAGEMYRIPSKKTELPTDLPTDIQPITSANVIQKIKLESTIRTAPKVITDSADGQKYILTQTENNQLHCLATTGEKRWSLNLRKPLLSKIIPLKNTKKGRTELLFNTEKSIYLYNLQGEAIQEPLDVKSKMTNGVLAIDFDNDENYQLFVASKNKNIYGFTLAGEPLANWSPLRKKGKFVTPLQHFNTADKDFIFGINDKGILEVFQRDGSDRFPHPIKIRNGYVTPSAYDLHPDMTRIIALDENGRLTVVNTEGESFSLNVRIGENQRPLLLFKDVVGDSRKDYIILNKTHLTAWSYTGKEFKVQYKIIFEDSTPSKLFAVENGIGIVDKGRAEINYFLNSGSQHPEFPLGGTTAFTVTNLFEDDQKCVVVGNRKEVYIYKINYEP